MIEVIRAEGSSLVAVEGRHNAFAVVGDPDQRGPLWERPEWASDAPQSQLTIALSVEPDQIEAADAHSAWLNQHGIAVAWTTARSILESTTPPAGNRRLDSEFALLYGDEAWESRRGIVASSAGLLVVNADLARPTLGHMIDMGAAGSAHPTPVPIFSAARFGEADSPWPFQPEDQVQGQPDAHPHAPAIIPGGSHNVINLAASPEDPSNLQQMVDRLSRTHPREGR